MMRSIPYITDQLTRTI